MLDQEVGPWERPSSMVQLHGLCCKLALRVSGRTQIISMIPSAINL